jgi:hypothetical protein
MKSNYPTLGDLSISQKISVMKRKGHMLYKIKSILDWERVQTILSEVEFKKSKEGGQEAYSALLVFRMLLIKNIILF